MTQEPLEQRVANLEMLLTHMERDVDEMNKALLQRGKQIDQLQSVVRRLAQGHHQFVQRSSEDHDPADEASYNQ